MRRLPRILLNAATGLSLVLCLLIAVSWARSDVRSDVPRPAIAGAAGTRAMCVEAEDGYLLITCAGPWPDAPSARRAAALLPHGPVGFDTPELTTMVEVLNRCRDEVVADRESVMTLAEVDDRLAWVAQAINIHPARGPRSWGISACRGHARLARRDGLGHVILESRVPLTHVAIPCWMGVVAFALLPAGVSVHAVRGIARRRAGARSAV